MKKLFIILCVFAAASCSKVVNHQPAGSAIPFFANQVQVSNIVTKTLQDQYPQESMISVDRISYLQSTGGDYAFVFYTTSSRPRSLVVKKSHGVQTNNVSVTTCAGDCDCKVKAILGNDGSIDVGCSCSSCKTVTSAFESVDL